MVVIDDTGRDGLLAQLLKDMTPVERGILLATSSSGRIPALLSELKLAVEYPAIPVKPGPTTTAGNGEAQ